MSMRQKKEIRDSRWENDMWKKKKERNYLELVWFPLERHNAGKVVWNQIVQDFVCRLHLFSPPTTHNISQSTLNARSILLPEWTPY